MASTGQMMKRERAMTAEERRWLEEILEAGKAGIPAGCLIALCVAALLLGSLLGLIMGGRRGWWAGMAVAGVMLGVAGICALVELPWRRARKARWIAAMKSALARGVVQTMRWEVRGVVKVEGIRSQVGHCEEPEDDGESPREIRHTYFFDVGGGRIVMIEGLREHPEGFGRTMEVAMIANPPYVVSVGFGGERLMPRRVIEGTKAHKMLLGPLPLAGETFEGGLGTLEVDVERYSGEWKRGRNELMRRFGAVIDVSGPVEVG